MSDDKETAKSIANILRILAKKIEEKPDLLEDIEVDIKDIPAFSQKRRIKTFTNFDIFQIFSDEGEQALRQKLELLDLRTLRIIVRQHGFDQSKLAEKWKNKERLVNLILERVAARSGKGKVFKNY